MFHVRSLHHEWTDDAILAMARRATEQPQGFDPTLPPDMLAAAPRIPYDEPLTAMIILLAITVVALLVGSVLVARKDFPLKD